MDKRENLKRDIFSVITLLITFFTLNPNKSIAQQSGWYYPKNETRWTGRVNTQIHSSNDELLVGTPYNRRGFIKFDISNIPDNATITQVDIEFYVNTASTEPSSHELVISSLYVDPVATSNSILWDEIDNTPDYITGNSWGDFPGSKSYSNVTTMINDIQSSLIKDWFAIGLFERLEDADDCNIDGYTSPNKPGLNIQFNLPAPTGVVATDGDYCDKVTVSWNSVDNADAYYIYRGSTYLGWTSNLNFDDIEGSTTSQTYNIYAAKTAAGTGHSDNNGSNNGYLMAVPSSPTSVSASDGDYCDKVRVSWGSVGGATSYDIYRNSVFIDNISSNSYDDNSASTSSTQYRVYAKNSCGTSVSYGSNNGYKGSSSEPPTNAFASLETICLNESTTLSQSDGDLGTGASWKWYSDSCGGAFVGSGGSISVSPESSTTYYVRAEGDCNPTGTDCANITITVVDPPIQPVPIEGEVSPCLSSNYTYTIDPVFGVTYTWDFTGSGTLDQNGSSCSLTPTSNGTLSVLASKDNCESTASTLPLTVTTNPAPPESVVGNFNICTNSEEVYEIDPVPGATSYRWELPSGWECIGNNCNSSSTITTKVGTNGGNIRVFAVNSCGESEYVQPVTIKGIAPDQPGPIMEEEGSPCEGSLRAYSVNEDPNVLSYEWTLPDGWSGNSNSNLIEVTVGSGNGEVCVVPINNCGEGQPICLNVIASTITDDPGLIEGDKTPCSGSTQTYVIPHILNATVYDWNFSGEGILNENNTSSCTLVPTTSGILEVTLSNKCGPSANTSTIAIAVAELPDTPSGVIAQDDMVKNEITITWEPVNGIDTYIIYRNGDSLTTRTSNRAYYTDNDAPCEVVTYEVYSFNGCLSEVAGSDTGYRLNCIPTGISEKHGFRVYPNPAEDKLTIILGESSPSFSKVTIHNSHGQVVLSSTINDWKIYNIDISSLTRGIYFIRLTGNDASVMKKFMIKS